MNSSETVVPTAWAIAKLEDIADLIRGIAFPAAAKSRGERAGCLICLRTTNVQKTVEWDDVWWIPTEFVKRAEQIVQDNDILISIANSSELVGKVAIIRQAAPRATIGAFIAVVRADKGIDGRWLYYFLASPQVQNRIRRLASTTVNIANVSTTKLRALHLPIVPAPEQTRIADRLDELFSELDAGVAALERAKAKLQAYRASILKAAVEGSLTAEWREKHPNAEPAGELLARTLVERRRRWEHEQLRRFKSVRKEPPRNWKAKYIEPNTPDTSALPLLPATWQWAAWPQIGFAQNGRPFPSKEYQTTGIKLLRPGNLYSNGTVQWNERNTRRLPDSYADQQSDLIVTGGELIINLTAQSLKDDFLGRVCITSPGERCLLNQRLARLTPLLVEARFMLWMFKSVHFRRFVTGLNTGSLIQHMFTSQLDGFVFPLPPLSEQEAIVEAVENQLSVVDHLETQLDRKSSYTPRLRQSVLRYAFTGKLVPQHPNDDPASELLRRIAGERDTRAAERTTPEKNPRNHSANRRKRESAA